MSFLRLPRTRSRILLIIVSIATLLALTKFAAHNYSKEFSSITGIDQELHSDLTQYEPSQPSSLDTTIDENEIFVEDEVVKPPPLDFTDKETPQEPEIKEVPAHKFWAEVFQMFEDCKIDDFGKGYGNIIQYVPKEESTEGYTEDALLSKATIDDESFEELKLKHKQLLQSLPQEIPSYAYNKGSKGIVMIGGGRFSWLSYLALVAVRETGSLLPVEIIIPTLKDYTNEEHFCTEVLPSLNARCVILPQELGTEVNNKWSKSFANYQFKSLSLIASSFEHIFLLDSDNMILSNPETIFESNIYKHYGMITWPDYWRRTISPKFYDIAGLSVNDRKRVRYNRYPLNVPKGLDYNLDEEEKHKVPFHDLEGTIPDLSTESGQFFINKGTHGRTLLLALYYNIYGPKLYYKLFSLGEQGEGDKDTFVAAAVVTKQKYYQIKSFIETKGYLENSGDFKGVAMAQKDPIKDDVLFENEVIKPLFKDVNEPQPINEQIKFLEGVDTSKFEHNDVPIFAVHCNYPKLDPMQYISRDDLYDSEKKRLKYRLYSSFSYDSNVGNQIIKSDFELIQWIRMKKILCEQKVHFVHFKNIELEDLCLIIDNQVKWLSSTS
ncbi:putative type II membrane protein [Scheffersomyces amazonensis]|uniref:putative type II membrane protein n=1 Tax=Scheffersomyces amazonensis TaxID=1078765 RepID=UPI00315DB1CF